MRVPFGFSLSNGLAFVVTNAAPTIEQLNGNATRMEPPGPGPALAMGIAGDDFVQGAVIYFNGVAIPTHFSEEFPGLLTGLVPVELRTVIGVFDVWVENPAPSAAPSNRLPFRVYGPPTITSVSRTTVNRGDSTAIIQVTVAEGDYLDSFSDIMIDGVRLETTFEGNTLDGHADLRIYGERRHGRGYGQQRPDQHQQRDPHRPERGAVDRAAVR